jgi:hypothetical protein
MTLRKFKWYLVAYVLFDFLLGYAGVFPLTNLAAAQFTTVSGTVTDPNGLPYANGTIVSVLILSSGVSPTLSGLPYTPPTQPVGLDPTGSFTIQLADNNSLSPAGTKWNFTVCSASGSIQPAGGKGPVCFTLAAPITITGTSQSITANLTAAALALTQNPGSGTVTHTAGALTLNCVPIGNGSADLKCSPNTTDNGTTFSTTDANGFLSPIFSTNSANPAASGVFRMANTQCIGWRNAANSADLTMCTDASNNIVPTGTTGFGSATNRWAVVGTNGNFNGTTSVQTLSNVAIGRPLYSGSAPTISSGFGTSPSIANNNGSGAFQVNVGTGGVATSGVISTPITATTGWICAVNNLTAALGNRADNTVQTASSTTTITIQNQTKSTGAAVAWTASDIVNLLCLAF